MGFLGYDLLKRGRLYLKMTSDLSENCIHFDQDRQTAHAEAFHLIVLSTGFAQ